jgi:UDP-2,3-diacylglucosamine hydrolase
MKSDCSNQRLQSIALQATSPILFISDLHLSEALPKTCAGFFRFIDEIAANAYALFILGDLFEYWIGDDCLNDTNSMAYAITQSLAQLKQRGIQVFILPGNRDFLLGRAFAEQTQAQMLDDICVLHAWGKQIVLAHGDSLCIDDHRYQRYRYWVHQPWLQHIFLMMPLAWRQKIALRLRQSSQHRHALASSFAAYQDVNNQFAQQLLQQYQSDILIHGHTHRAQCHALTQGIRWVLSDWDWDYAQRANYLCLDDSGLYALNFS